VPIELTDTYFDRKSVGDFETLVAQYRKSEFEPPFRSTIPLLCLIRDKPILNDLMTRCGFSSDCEFRFEFQVSPPLGDGKPSRIDLMLIDDGQCVAIDAKWTEPLSELVKDWLGPQPTTNRRDVLSGWLSLVNRQATIPVTAEAVGEVSYQLLHCAASACNTSNRPQVCTLQFRSKQDDDAAMSQVRRDDLARLRDALGRPDRFAFRYIEIDIEPTPAFHKLAKLPKRSKKSAIAVQQALVSETLFAFNALRDLLV